LCMFELVPNKGLKKIAQWNILLKFQALVIIFFFFWFISILYHYVSCMVHIKLLGLKVNHLGWYIVLLSWLKYVINFFFLFFMQHEEDWIFVIESIWRHGSKRPYIRLRILKNQGQVFIKGIKTRLLYTY